MGGRECLNSATLALGFPLDNLDRGGISEGFVLVANPILKGAKYRAELVYFAVAICASRAAAASLATRSQLPL